MRGMIPYSRLAQVPLMEAITEIRNTSRIRYGDMTLADLLLVGSITDLKLSEHIKRQCYGRGVYVFFDGDEPQYVGKATSFLDRLSSHQIVDLRPNWGWNALMTLVRAKRLNLTGNPTAEEMIQVLSLVESFGVVRVLLDSEELSDKLHRLERVIKNALQHQYGTLLNGGVGKLSADEMARPLGELLLS